MDARRLIAVGALLMFCAAMIAMLMAANEPFEPEAQVRRLDRVAMTALTHVGDRLVAAGERGRILVSADRGMTWKVVWSPTHDALTSVSFADARTGFATGHRGVLLRTEDGGITWQQAKLDGPARPALFAARVQGLGGIAVGAYAAYYETRDAGRTWTPRPIGPADFDRHFTGIAACGNRCLVIAGEGGTILRSEDNGESWQLMPPPYEGSFFGALGIPNGTVLVYGMRGHAYRSTDAGRTWQRVDLDGYTGALQGAALQDDGSVVLTGADGLIATSRDGAATFSLATMPGRLTVAGAAAVGARMLCAGPAGLRWADGLR